MRKNIALLIPNLSSGGAEKVISEVSIMLSKKFNVFLITFDENDPSYSYKGELVNMNLKSKGNFLLKIYTFFKRILILNKLKKKHKIDLTISFLRSSNLVNIYSNKLGKKIISCRGHRDFLKSSNLYYRKSLILDGILFPSESMRNNFITSYENRVDEEKIFYLPNPLDTEKINCLKKEPLTKEISELFINNKIICHVGSFKEEKGHMRLIKAFEEIRKKRKDVKLVLIGSGGPLEKEIYNKVKASTFTNDILLLGNQSNPYKFIARSDVFVLPSLNEGFPNVLIEAMACKKPVVATDCLTGPREILIGSNNEKYGVLISQNGSDENTIIKEIEKNVLLIFENKKYSEKYSELSIVRSQKYAFQRIEKRLFKIIEAVFN